MGDAALARRFQTVFVAEPSVADTVSILRGLKENIIVGRIIPAGTGYLYHQRQLEAQKALEEVAHPKAVTAIDAEQALSEAFKVSYDEADSDQY